MQGAHGLRIERFEERQQAVTQEVAAVTGVGIGGVGDVVLTVLFKESQYFAFAPRKERAHNAHLAVHAVDGIGCHAAKAAKSRAAHKVEQKGFGIVLHMVRHGYGGVAFFITKPGEPFVAQTACGHFYAFARCGSFTGGVEVRHMELHAAGFAELSHETFVAHALFAAQMEVAVGGGGLLSVFQKVKQQRHGVGTAAEGYKHL